MPQTERFDYDAALQRLMELRFNARQADQAQSEEMHQLEQQIYAYVLCRDDDTEAPAVARVKPRAEAA